MRACVGAQRSLLGCCSDHHCHWILRRHSNPLRVLAGFGLESAVSVWPVTPPNTEPEAQHRPRNTHPNTGTHLINAPMQYQAPWRSLVQCACAGGKNCYLKTLTGCEMPADAVPTIDSTIFMVGGPDCAPPISIPLPGPYSSAGSCNNSAQFVGYTGIVQLLA